MNDYVEVQSHVFVLNLATIGAFLAHFEPFWSYFLSCGQVQKLFWGPTYVTNQLWF